MIPGGPDDPDGLPYADADETPTGSGQCGIEPWWKTCYPVFTPQHQGSGTATLTWSVNIGNTNTVLGVCVTVNTETNQLPVKQNNVDCCQQTYPVPSQSTCCGGFDGGCSMTPVWVQSACAYECENVSPIILDIDGNGYHLTNWSGPDCHGCRQ